MEHSQERDEDASAELQPGPGAVRRGSGVNASERYLLLLAEHTFLSLWSYLGVYRDQKRPGGSDGKEVCDLLIVFGDHLVIFSDKDVAYQPNIDPRVAWRRWFKAAVQKSAEQVYGAERWIRAHPTRLFLDRRCTQRFPLPLPPPHRMLVHRVVVAHGSSEACERAVGGSGSLVLVPTLTGDDHLAPEGIESPSWFHRTGFDSYPLFCIGIIDPQKGFVHVLDDSTLDTLLRTLDTVTDFIEYLTRKERLITQGKLLFALGEENLLAHYLRDIGSDGWHDFRVPDNVTGIAIPSGLWSRFAQHPQRLAQLEADKASYTWDSLIERFNRHILNDTQFGASTRGVASEPIVRFLARESRTRRRFLVHVFAESYASLEDGEPWTVKVVAPSYAGDPHYVFLVMRLVAGEEYSEYRTRRSTLLNAYMHALKAVMPQAQEIVGIATGPIGNENSEDAGYLDTRTWTSEDQRAAEELQRTTGLLANLRRQEAVIQTYPDPSSGSAGRPPAR